MKNIYNIRQFLDISRWELKNIIFNKYKLFFFDRVEKSPRLELYAKIKRVYKREYYLTGNLSCKQKQSLTKCRISAHDFQIELGRRQKQLRDNRLCNLCDKRELGDEFHYILKCTYAPVVTIRKELMEKVNAINSGILNLPEKELFIYLVNAHDTSIVFHFAKFLETLMKITKCIP